LHRRAHLKFQRSRRLEARALQDLFPALVSTRAVVLAPFLDAARVGNPNAYELVVLSCVCAYLRPMSVFEFGTYNGLSTLHFAINSPEQAVIRTIDLDPSDPMRQTDTDDVYYTRNVPVGQHFRGTPEDRKILQIFVNTLEYDPSDLVHSVDLAFVDAGHALDAVQSDSEKALRMLAPGGVILWHDYSFKHHGVYSCLNSLAERLPLYQIDGTSIACYHAPGDSR
jgi:predicted O-methyltransferase YrrM